MTITTMKRQRQQCPASASMSVIFQISILSAIVVSSAVDAFGSIGMPQAGRSVPRTLQQPPLHASELKQSSLTQFNDDDDDASSLTSSLQEQNNVLRRHVELGDESSLVGLNDEDMMQAMSEQMSDLLTTLDDGSTTTNYNKAESSEYDDDDEERSTSIPETLNETLLYDVDVYEEEEQEDYEEDPILKELEETLLATIQVLEDTLHETQVVNELETREFKEEQVRLEQELQRLEQFNEQIMAQFQVEQTLAATSSKAPQQLSSLGSLESLLQNPSSVPKEGLVLTQRDLTQLLELQQERHDQEKKELEQQLRHEEKQRLELEQVNLRLEAEASAAAKAMMANVEDKDTTTKQQQQQQQDTEGALLQTKLNEQQEALELANQNLEQVESELTRSKQALEKHTASAKSELAAFKTKEQQLVAKIDKLESEMTKLAVNDAKARETISNLEVAKQELEGTLEKARHETEASKEASTSSQKELTRVKQSLAERMVKIGRMETKLARAQIIAQSSSSSSSLQPKKTTTAPTKKQTEQPPKESSPVVTALKTPRLENWELTKDGEVIGSVFNHPSLPDGEPVRTSALVNPMGARDGITVNTKSGSRYKLGTKKTNKTIAPKQPAAAASTKPAPSVGVKEQVPSSPPTPAATKETKAKKSSPSIDLFANLQNKPAKKETSLKKDEEPKPIKAETPKSKKTVTPTISSIFGSASSKAKKKSKEDTAAKTKPPKTPDAAKSPPSTSIPLPRINFFGNAHTEKTQEGKTKEFNNTNNNNKEPEDQGTGSKRQPYTPFNIFGSKSTGSPKDKLLTHGNSIPAEKQTPEPTKATARTSTSAYGKRKAQKSKAISQQQQQQQQQQQHHKDELTLTGRTICDGKYLLAGKAKKSVTGRCLILGAYHADTNDKPTGNPIVIKLSENTDAMKKEHSIYKRVASGVSKGVVVKCHDFVSDVQDRPGKSALVLERGVRDLKEHRRWIGMEGNDLKEALYSVGQCLDTMHGARMVWTDCKTENFVVVESDSKEEDGGHKVKAIDLESAMNWKEHPRDFTPEASPPEFAKEYVSGDPHSFVLDYSYDVWSFGMLAYELATGIGYYDGNSPDAIMQKLSHKNVPNPSIGIEDDDLADLVSLCLALDPKQRPSAQKIVRHPYFASISKPTLFNLW
ncbi:unnamed protein product [Cylindrotheca closterium]|uniref:Protein kinase domain-containing protein n=1 Tax=Cylindrotheca closterium TaxID=2856 RepID=A0AAD2FR04_9STRA|nr:unnamed protein product [Cylindrotheca closterium]